MIDNAKECGGFYYIEDGVNKSKQAHIAGCKLMFLEIVK